MIWTVQSCVRKALVRIQRDLQRVATAIERRLDPGMPEELRRP